jgi:NADPH-dependent 2,4-dienoyl-CoA reductase/sulfur reductase-like enzyme
MSDEFRRKRKLTTRGDNQYVIWLPFLYTYRTDTRRPRPRLRERVIKTMNDIVSRPPPLDTLADAQLRSEAAAVATHAERKPRIVIVGGGFGGVAAARALRKSDAEVFLIDRRNHHIFQPLLYQVATAVLSPSEVAAPIRQLARKQKNLSVMLAEVTDLDLKSRSVTIRSDGIGTRIVPFPQVPSEKDRTNG